MNTRSAIQNVWRFLWHFLCELFGLPYGTPQTDFTWKSL